MTPAGGATVLTCGQPFRLPAGGGLTLTGRFPTRAPAHEPTVAGTVEITSQVAVRGMVAPGADAFLVRHGRVVTIPMPQDLAGVRWELTPGDTARLPAAATLASCHPGGGRVPPGDYDLYARVVLVPDHGPAIESYGGPWPIEVP